MADPLEPAQEAREKLAALSDEADRLQAADSTKAEWTDLRDSLVLAALYEIPSVLAGLSAALDREATLKEAWLHDLHRAGYGGESAEAYIAEAVAITQRAQETIDAAFAFSEVPASEPKEETT